MQATYLLIPVKLWSLLSFLVAGAAGAGYNSETKRTHFMH